MTLEDLKGMNQDQLLRLYAKHGTFDKCAVVVGVNRKTFAAHWYDIGMCNPKFIEKIDYELDTYKIAACSDLHLGSKQQCLTPFMDFINVCRDQEVKTLLIPGDICEGLSKRDGSVYHRFLHSIDDISDYVMQVFQNFADDFERIYICEGNHDATLNKRSMGFDLCRELSNEYSSIKYLKSPDEVVQPAIVDGGAKIVLYHGDGGCAANLSNRTRTKTIDFINSDIDFDMIICAHCHRPSYDFWLQKYGISLGCFQSTTEYLARLAKKPMVQGDIISYKIDDKQRMRDVVRVAYNYDHKIILGDY